MNKTINTNVGGLSFNLEEDAYKALDEYLESIKACYSDNCNATEITSDIEARIGELLNEIKRGSEVVTLPMVECAKQRIGNPDELKAEEIEAEQEDSNTTAKPQKIKRKLYRDMDNKHVAGVCSGIAAYFDIEAAWIRIAWCLLFFGGLFTDWKWLFNDGKFGFFVFLIYCILWICIPEAKTVRQKCEMRGEPLRLDEFHNYVPQSETVVRRRRSTMGNIICYITGIILMIIGICIAMCGISLPFGQCVFAENSYNININGIGEPWMSYLENGLVMLDGYGFWWIAGMHFLVLGIGIGYAGLKFALNLKSPKWYPGLILFLLWFATLIALAIYCSVNVFLGGAVLN